MVKRRTVLAIPARGNDCPRAFVWYGQTKTWQKLDAPTAWYTDFYGINDKGMIVGDYRNRTGIHGVVLTPAGK